MSEMTEMPAGPQQPELPSARSRGSARSTVAWLVAAVAVSALLGLACGLVWGEFAPRAALQEVGAGTAQFVNVETRAFFGADVWFCGIGAVAGLVTGIIGYRFGVAPREGGRRAAVAAALIAGAVAGSLTMLWLGERIGLSGYNHDLASSAPGTLFSASLVLGAKSALAVWALLTSAVLFFAELGRRQPPPEPWT
jgi:hypothetical protein